MSNGKNRRRAALYWLFVAGLFVLCGVLGVLQYRWIGEVSVAARDRLRGSLQASLNRLSLDFNSEIATACRALLPAAPVSLSPAAEADVAVRYAQWKKTLRRGQMFRHIAIAEPRNKDLVLRNLDLDKAVFETAQWPPDWAPVKARLESMLSPETRQGRGFPGPPPDDQGMLFDLPAFGIATPGRPIGQFERGETPSLIFDLSPEYVRDVLLPELLQRHLETGGTLEYQVEVLSRQRTPLVIFQSDPGARVAASADASVGLFDTPYDQIFRRSPGPGGRGRGPGRGGLGGDSGRDSGRWQMFVRHRAGSLEAVVAQARWRNLAVTAGVLLLMMASVAALITYTRRAQKLADLQMDFVAGISHELRTPLTVIHTAAYNLRGKLAANPAQVERYGVLIQQESGRLKDLVEQVLRFSGATAGRVIQNPEPLSIPDLLEDTLESARAVFQEAGCVVEKHIDPDLPLVMGDPMALKQALQNLLHNAAKYGAGDSRWVGVSASRTGGETKPAVEIRVADRGPGIPADEQAHIFEPFFRGRRALQDQIHGTGLGLNLAKKIIQAHGGSIQVKSAAINGAEFVVRLPAAPTGEPA
jgi:signal transduction histidine kinase